MLGTIKESIRVAVIFGPGNRVRPVWFDWGNRKHEVREITYTWRERAGESFLFHFAVTDGASLFELVYDATGQRWELALQQPD